MRSTCGVRSIARPRRTATLDGPTSTCRGSGQISPPRCVTRPASRRTKRTSLAPFSVERPYVPNMTAPERFLAACKRMPVDRTPVWMMRQAGRYLPEYRAVRSRVDFLTLCKTPDLASEVSLQPIERFGMDACVIFSDIMMAVEAMGAPVSFGDGGPHIDEPVRSMAAVERLRVTDPSTSLGYALEALRMTREALRDRAALVGFVGGPFTLASYLVEGGGSKSFSAIKTMLYAESAVAHALLAKFAEFCALYAIAQVRAGAQAVQVFDTWAGELSPA